MAPCTAWSSFDTDKFTGPVAPDTANPVLVIGNSYDPATLYKGALASDGLL